MFKVCVCVCVCVRVLVQERGGASDQPPAERERIQQRAASCREAAGRRRRLPRAHTLQPHFSGTVCVCACLLLKYSITFILYLKVKDFHFVFPRYCRKVQSKKQL